MEPTNLKKVTVRFPYAGPNSEVKFSADWTGFQREPARYESGVWMVEADLFPGKYLYAFTVGGQIKLDPNAASESNSYGEVYNVLHVEGGDPKVTVRVAQVEDGVKAVQFKVPHSVIEAHVPRLTTKTVFIALDRSGSMMGPYRLATAAVENLIKQLRDYGINDIHMFFYDHRCNVEPTEKLDAAGLKALMARYPAEGGTDFILAFDTLSEEARKKHGNPLSIVFLTDGMHSGRALGNGIESPAQHPSFDTLKQLLEGHGATTDAHCLGFTSSHDARLLQQIAGMGTGQGSFQYVPNSNAINESTQRLFGLVAGTKVNTVVPLGDRRSSKLILDDSGVGFVYLTDADYENWVKNPTLVIGSSTATVDSVTTLTEIRDKLPLVLKNVEFSINQLLSQLTSKANLEKFILESIKKRATQLEETLNTISLDVIKLRAAAKKQIGPEILQVKELLSSFHALLAKAFSGSMSNEAIAQFTSMAYRGVIEKRSLKKQLDKRAQNNAQIMDELDGKIQEALKTIDFGFLYGEFSGGSYLEDTKCPISLKNWVEALEDGDCVCLGVNVRRNPAAIADPSLTVIKSVSSTFITADSFMECMRSRIEEYEHGYGAEDEFEPLSLPGLAQERINAVIPIFLNEDHWKVAKLKMKPLLGWLTTLDPLGYAYSQVKNIPFLVLGKIIEEAAKGSDFKMRQFDYMLRTCQKIYQDGKYKDEVVQNYWNYTRNPAQRTVDVVPNNIVFLAHVLTAVSLGDLTLSENDVTVDRFFQQISEEESRRIMNRAFYVNDIGEPLTADIVKLLGFDEERYIDEPVREYKRQRREMAKAAESSGVSKYKIAMENARFGGSVDHMREKQENTAPTPTPATPEAATASEADMPVSPAGRVKAPEYDGVVQMNDLSTSFVNKTEKACRRAMHLIRQFKSVITAGGGHPDLGDGSAALWLENYDAAMPLIPSAEVKALAAYLQCWNQRKNADRRAAIEAGRYYNPFESQAERRIFKTILDTYASSKRESEASAVLAAEQATLGDFIGKAFADATDPEEAAGVVLLEVVYQGSASFKSLITALYDPNIPCAVEKLAMLVAGEFRGITLIRDKIKSKPNPGAPVRWIPGCRRHNSPNFPRIFAAHKDKLTMEQWIQLLPSWEAKIRRKFDYEARVAAKSNK